MSELENEENIKNTIQDTQMLIRNHMQHHKKISKQLHSQIKKDKKSIELFKDKITKLLMEKAKLEDKQKVKSESGQFSTPDIQNLKNQIMQEMEQKKAFDDKIAEIQQDFLTIKNEMGGLNATEALQKRYEKHIRILENRLDKANQKFNDSIEYDKKLRAEIDKLRKERFFFENIYKKLEKELEKVRKDISKNLEDAYDNYEQRDNNQEQFENLKAQMIKKETEYTNILSGIANDLNIRNSRKKSQERKNLNNLKIEEQNNQSAKNYAKKIKSEQYEQQQENLNEKYLNLKYKFEKLVEFTEQPSHKEFCEEFKKNVQQNFDLFLNISMISSEAKKLESDIKEIEEEINGFKKYKNSQQGIQRHTLISELKTKTQKLIQRQDKYENEYKNYIDDFNQMKNNIQNIFDILKCDENLNDEEKLEFKDGVNENNVLAILAKIEKKLKYNQRILEYEHNIIADDQETGMNHSDQQKNNNPKLVNDNMKIAFANMDMSKLKTFEDIKNAHKMEDFKFENLKLYSENVAKEIMENINKANQNDKKQQKNHQKLLKSNNNI